jgi:hypothetical protein
MFKPHSNSEQLESYGMFKPHSNSEQLESYGMFNFCFN